MARAHVLLKQLWCQNPLACYPAEQSRLGLLTATDEVGAAGCAGAFEECLPFLQQLFAQDPGHLELVDSVVDAVASLPATATADMERGPEPRINYQAEHPNCRTDPGEIKLPEVIAARVLWGGLSPVLNPGWLRWQKITHVLCCLGTMDPNYMAATAARTVASGIEYIDWCIGHKGSKDRYLSKFVRLESIMRSPTSCLYVHCKSGKDRSTCKPKQGRS